MQALTEFVGYENGSIYWIKRKGPRTKIGLEIGSPNHDGYLIFKYNGCNCLVHRFIYEKIKGSIPEGFEIDHIDGNKTNNKIENLRIATKAQNQHNSKMSKTNKSGVKGLSWQKRGNYWVGSLRINGKVCRKYSHSREEIEKWLITKREILHKEFTNHGK